MDGRPGKDRRDSLDAAATNRSKRKSMGEAFQCFKSHDCPQEINGINLADYYPNQRSFNTVVYVHKNYLQKTKKLKTIQKEKKEKEIKEKEAKQKKKSKNKKCDKCQQCEQECSSEIYAMNNSMLAQSLQFTKTMIPVVIPPSGIASPIYYTIKASKKTKDKKKPKQEVSAHTQTFKKERTKKVIETYRNDGAKESLSIKETVSYSSRSDTLDELQMNPSLCCTLSEISDNKQVRKEKKDKPKHEIQKVITSESFEALATEFLNTSGDTKIKIHLMNETEKNLLTENIRVPVLNAIRECILEINSQRHNTESTIVQKFVRCNNEKLDNIMDKLTCMEQKLNYIHSDNASAKAMPHNMLDRNLKPDGVEVLKPPRVKLTNKSQLERVGEDILELVDENSTMALEMRDSSGDEYYSKPTLSARKKKTRGKSAVLHLDPAGVDNSDEREGLGCGEKSNMPELNSNQSEQLVRPDRTGRIPARFCWTDAARKNAMP